MADAIENSTSRMNDADLAATAVYLKGASGYPGAVATALPDSDPHMKAGRAVYEDNCMGCHNADGKGQKDIFPPLSTNPIVRQASAESIIRVVLAGTQSADVKAAPTQPAMPSFAWRLDDQEVADVLTYVRSSWGGAAPVFEATVRQIRGNLVRENRAR
jgi:mono/diheme cytochrome c family protein